MTDNHGYPGKESSDPLECFEAAVFYFHRAAASGLETARKQAGAGDVEAASRTIDVVILCTEGARAASWMIAHGGFAPAQ